MRKKKENTATRIEDTEMKSTSEEVKIELAFRIWVNERAREVILEWLKGSDQVLWESFCGMIHRNFKKT